MQTTVEIAEQLGLTADEFERVKSTLGRSPNFTELSMYAAMWSEHCSYKNSLVWLKTLTREGDHLPVKAGDENAGLVDIGEGNAVVFKIESHNHPSAIEPFQGAATGVGGIHRDIFTMGARPIALLNSLRFGSFNNNKSKDIIKGVAAGISHYGKDFGVPAIGGEIYFESNYQSNPLVNVMSVGVVKTGQTISATAYGDGNPVFIVGGVTGKDGIGGAVFASADITEDSAEDLPEVQQSNPVLGKKLLEACLEVAPTKALIGMQDIGAAGITCCAAEMSAKGEHGMILQLDKVPARHPNMRAWEILLSESQERMLMVVKKGQEQTVIDIFTKWELHCAQIGHVTADKNLKCYLHETLEADVPAASLVPGGGAPQYHRAYTVPAYFEKIRPFDIQFIPDTNNPQFVAERMIAQSNIASKRWIYNQYNGGTTAPSDAAIVPLPGTDKALAVTTDCNSRYVYADPHQGAQIAVAEAARNIVCSGAEPLAISNCLNFGNPYDPEVYYQFVYALKGITEACRKFNTPITGGNVSFYNQSPDGAIYPTPVIGMLGILENQAALLTQGFKQEGDLIYLLGRSRNDISSSEYLHKIIGIEYSPVPHFNIEEELHLQRAVSKLNKAGVLQSAHDVSEGGLFISVFESAIPNGLGFEIRTNDNFRTDAFLFGESQSRVIVSIRPEDKEKFDAVIHTIIDATDISIRAEKIGVVKGDTIVVDNEVWGKVAEWKRIYNTAVEEHLK
ncbi:phosphoribosylformylglycinamidine synthase subunit PurL [Chitinophaga sp. sic0106]|uniref:phosphoribosylformylglycinamidine synthase subunit PurL n=1 Tax=Chitinophaga sp. sic0106 TaxID=2854785 RepID=UPI001C48C77F|nr:phosphoribosylformylglycinamidine synthase subunit PurL [Chitinophaga sp. sic0106]MBV7533586.1 phosphoribosylformylglycinamidine synthase subunit PurL [Chitinophaga sp. sic0106]